MLLIDRRPFTHMSIVCDTHAILDTERDQVCEVLTFVHSWVFSAPKIGSLVNDHGAVEVVE